MVCKFHIDGSLPKRTHYVWVFGSNLSGIHGAGAAKIAHTIYNRPYYTEHGTYVSGNLQESYAIPTKSVTLTVLPIKIIQLYVDVFIRHVELNENKEFFVTRIGCGLAGYKDSDIAPLFSKLSNRNNVSFAEEWREYLGCQE